MGCQIERFSSLVDKRLKKEERRAKANLKKKRQKPFSRFLYLVDEPIKGLSITFKSKPGI